ncbi:hypothetical protein [Methanolapillus ohkumae]
MKHICPQCGYTELYMESGGIMGNIYHCKRCNYVGSFVIEGEEDMIQEIEEGRKVETGKP